MNREEILSKLKELKKITQADIDNLVPEDMKNDPEFAKQLIDIQANTIIFLPQEIRNNLTLILEASKSATGLLRCVSKDVMVENPELTVEIVKIQPGNARSLPEEVRQYIINERTDLLEVLMDNNDVNYIITRETKLNSEAIECVIKYAKENPERISKISYLFTKEVMQKLLEGNSEESLNILSKLSRETLISKYKELGPNPALLSKMLEIKPGMIFYFNDKVKKDYPEIVLKALEEEPSIIFNQSDDFQKQHEEIVLKALEENPLVILDKGYEFQMQHKDILLMIIKKMPESIKSMGKISWNNRDYAFLEEAISVNPQVLDYIGREEMDGLKQFQEANKKNPEELLQELINKVELLQKEVLELRKELAKEEHEEKNQHEIAVERKLDEILTRRKLQEEQDDRLITEAMNLPESYIRKLEKHNIKTIRELKRHPFVLGRQGEKRENLAKQLNDLEKADRIQIERRLQAYMQEDSELDETLAKAEQLEQIQENGNKIVE